ncbi:Putative AC9 transposase [Frankliniella fusca]|uniref:AC9 transposase n=1 Tax=Frankliniella fusca TaxID=407009 RepID=A0AAE1H6L3_9NEOP|nr:Putative AC9 transposase [Frankliniella fusca]
MPEKFVKSKLRELCAEQEQAIRRRGAIADTLNPLPAKRRRHSSEDYDILLGDTQQSSPTDEVEKYVLLAKCCYPVRSTDILQWWKEKSSELPVLSRVARIILATPVSSSASDRNFSVAGRLITPRRNCLAADTVDVLLFLHNYFKQRKQQEQPIAINLAGGSRS